MVISPTQSYQVPVGEPEEKSVSKLVEGICEYPADPKKIIIAKSVNNFCIAYMI
jgi:hypothetical protein